MPPVTSNIVTNWKGTKLTGPLLAIFNPDHPLCPTCGKELKIGDWPWCNGKPEDHSPPPEAKKKNNYQFILKGPFH